MILANGAVGPLDEIVQIVLPLAVFALLWWWSSRKEKRK